MGQTAIDVAVEHGQLLPQPVFALPQRADPSPDRGPMLPDGEVEPLHEGRVDGEHGDAGGYAATGISSTSRSMSEYQRLKMALSSPFSVRTRVCNNKCAPALDHCIVG